MGFTAWDAEMRDRQEVARSSYSDAEIWMRKRLMALGLKWTRHARWGRRLFDFWSASLGIAIDLQAGDAARDRELYGRAGILVVRVRPFQDADADEALRVIRSAETWNARREAIGLPLMGRGKA